MDEHFDPYHVWLGIAPEEQPPDHYRLLGIRQFESNREVIANAADQRIAHIRTFQTGSRSKHSQRLLNELSAASVCLLNPEKRAAYDAQLVASQASLQTPSLDRSQPEPRGNEPPDSAAPPLPPPVAAVIQGHVLQQNPSTYAPVGGHRAVARRSRQSGWGVVMMLVIVVAGLAIAILVAVVRQRGKQPALLAESEPIAANSELQSNATTDATTSRVETPSLDDESRASAIQLDAMLRRLRELNLTTAERPEDVRRLVLNRAEIVNVDLELIVQMPKLDDLTIAAESAITDAGLLHLNRARQLKILRLANPQLTSQGFLQLRELSPVEINLSGSRISLGDVSRLPMAATISRLTSPAVVLGEELATLGSLKNLKSLDLSPADIADDAFTRLPPLTSLETLRLPRSASDRSLDLHNKTPSLKTLFLSSQQAADGAFRNLSGLRKLELLVVEGNVPIDSQTAALRLLPSLRILQFFGDSVGDEGLAGLVGAPRLETLTFAAGSRLTDAGLLQLRSLSTLRKLQIPTDAAISDDAVNSLRQAIPGLEVQRI